MKHLKAKTAETLKARAITLDGRFRDDAERCGVDLEEFFNADPERDDFGFCELCDEWFFGHDECPCGR